MLSMLGFGDKHNIEINLDNLSKRKKENVKIDNQ
jgi:hypothetical protein